MHHEPWVFIHFFFSMFCTFFRFGALCWEVEPQTHIHAPQEDHETRWWVENEWATKEDLRLRQCQTEMVAKRRWHLSSASDQASFPLSESMQRGSWTLREPKFIQITSVIGKARQGKPYYWGQISSFLPLLSPEWKIFLLSCDLFLPLRGLG